MKLTDEQRRVLKRLRAYPQCARDLGTGIRTFMALEKRKLIRVETTLASIAFPQKALAYITDEGRAAVFTLQRRHSEGKRT